MIIMRAWRRKYASFEGGRWTFSVAVADSADRASRHPRCGTNVVAGGGAQVPDRAVPKRKADRSRPD